MLWLAALGRCLIAFVTCLGRLALLAREVLVSCGLGRLRLRHLWPQLARAGFGSQPVVIVTGAFTGAVLAAQTPLLISVRLENAVGGLVTVAMCRELGPVLTGLMLAGRVGAAMTAEIGTMKVSDQIDALRSLAIHPVDHLVTPRVVALMISIPLLVVESVFFGILASWLIATRLYRVEDHFFWTNLTLFDGAEGLLMSAMKGLFFGLIIALVACQQGLEARDGAVGVGRATTRGVVVSSLAILISNFFLSLGLNPFFGTMKM